jgi:excisionase family DNA binding protein
MLNQPAPESFGDYLTVKAAAALLGVCADTVRNWDRAGKLVAVRHPINGYRLYRREELLALLSGTATRRAVEPPNRRGTVASGR